MAITKTGSLLSVGAKALTTAGKYTSALIRKFPRPVRSTGNSFRSFGEQAWRDFKHPLSLGLNGLGLAMGGSVGGMLAGSVAGTGVSIGGRALGKAITPYVGRRAGRIIGETAGFGGSMVALPVVSQAVDNTVDSISSKIRPKDSSFFSQSE